MTEEKPDPEVDDPGRPQGVALVVLPFPDEASANTFAQLVQGQSQGATAPVITKGSVYEYFIEETRERFQVVEFHGTWEGFDATGGGAIVQRPIWDQPLEQA